MLLAQKFDSFNPLIIASTKASTFATPGAIITTALNNYLFPFAGFALFVMIVWGGFEMMTSSVSGKKDAGRQRVTSAVIGFLLLFSVFWIAQLVQGIFGVRFLGGDAGGAKEVLCYEFPDCEGVVRTGPCVYPASEQKIKCLDARSISNKMVDCYKSPDCSNPQKELTKNCRAELGQYINQLSCQQDTDANLTTCYKYPICNPQRIAKDLCTFENDWYPTAPSCTSAVDATTQVTCYTPPNCAGKVNTIPGTVCSPPSFDSWSACHQEAVKPIDCFIVPTCSKTQLPATACANVNGNFTTQHACIESQRISCFYLPDCDESLLLPQFCVGANNFPDKKACLDAQR